MRHTLAAWAVNRANATSGATAVRFNQLASWLDPRWSAPRYNLGLQAKYEGRWKDSVRFNQQALELNPADEAAWWNLGISATALRDWALARRAWLGFGVQLGEGSGEVSMPAVSACVRLNPNVSGEVVWGDRLDPARIVVSNVPLPESGRRFRDIILNDGAPNGKRTWRGVEVPVFDELAVWQASAFSTFETGLTVPNQQAEETLMHVCSDHGIGVEDWSTIRMICSQCSHANPGPYDEKSAPSEEVRRFGFGARQRGDVEAILEEWTSQTPEASYTHLELALEATA